MGKTISIPACCWVFLLWIGTLTHSDLYILVCDLSGAGEPPLSSPFLSLAGFLVPLG